MEAKMRTIKMKTIKLLSTEYQSVKQNLEIQNHVYPLASKMINTKNAGSVLMIAGAIIILVGAYITGDKIRINAAKSVGSKAKASW